MCYHAGNKLTETKGCVMIAEFGGTDMLPIITSKRGYKSSGTSGQDTLN